MLLKLFGKNKKSEFDDADLPCVCRFCEHATLINDEQNVLCSVRGIVFADYCCRKFSYDPLKREPKMLPPIPKPDPTQIDIGLPSYLLADSPAGNAAGSSDTAESKNEKTENSGTAGGASESAGAASSAAVPGSDGTEQPGDKSASGDTDLPDDKPAASGSTAVG